MPRLGGSAFKLLVFSLHHLHLIYTRRIKVCVTLFKTIQFQFELVMLGRVAKSWGAIYKQLAFKGCRTMGAAQHRGSIPSNPHVRFLTFPRIFLQMLLRFIAGTASNIGRRLDNVHQTHLVLASGKLVLQKRMSVVKLDLCAMCSRMQLRIFANSNQGFESHPQFTFDGLECN